MLLRHVKLEYQIQLRGTESHTNLAYLNVIKKPHLVSRPKSIGMLFTPNETTRPIIVYHTMVRTLCGVHMQE
jgi:hypothetical protein